MDNLYDINRQHLSGTSSQITFSEIKYIKEFLEECLNMKVIDYTIKPLTKPGDNYGGVLQSIEVRAFESNDSDKVNKHGR